MHHIPSIRSETFQRLLHTMLPIRKLSERVSVTGWLHAADFVEIRSLGFDKVVNFRPDHETRGQETSDQVRLAAEAAGLRYVHIPVTKHDLFADAVVAAGADEYGDGSRVLGYCAGGPRAAIVWAAAQARKTPVASVLTTLHEAGFDLGFIRDDLDAQADRSRWSKDQAAPSSTGKAANGRAAHVLA